jgi:hypothetical protein
MDATMMKYVVNYTQQELARARGQSAWRTLFKTR